MKSICIFGDSITWGAGDYEKGGWVNRLRLFADDQRIGAWTYNLGISGDNTNDLLVRFEVEADAREADILIFSIGANDSAYTDTKDNHPVPLKGFEKNIARLILAAKKITKKIVFVGLTHVDEKKTMPVKWDKSFYYENINVALYDAEIKKATTHYGVDFIPLVDAIKTKDLADGLHPNAKGHQKIFEEVRDFLIEKRWI